MKLKINNKDLNFNIDLEFMGNFISEADKPYNELLQLLVNNPFKYYPLAMYISCQVAYEKELDFTLKEFTKWLSNEGGLSDANENVKKWSDAFSVFILGDHPLEEETDEDSSKKK